MRFIFDTDLGTLETQDGSAARTFPLYSDECFKELSDLWVQIGWNQKYVYTFSWLGRPIIQLPEDLVRIQEVIYDLKPDVIVETGVAHGGSLVFYAGLFKAMGKGRLVVGVDIEIRPHNRAAIEQHELFPSIALIEGDSIAPGTLDQVRALIRPGEKVLVILDSNHTKDHVLGELEAYHALVTGGSYLVATDGVMQAVKDTPRGKPEWAHDNPIMAALAFAQAHPDFTLVQPAWPFNESTLTRPVTHWPGAWLRRA